MSHSLCRRQTMIRLSFPILLYHTSPTKISSCYSKDVSIHPALCIAGFFSRNIPDPSKDSVHGVQGAYSKQLATCVFLRLSPILCMHALLSFPGL